MKLLNLLKIKIVLATALLLGLVIPSFAQSTQTAAEVDLSRYVLNERAYKQAANVYGFVHGQRLVLQTMKRQFPAYAPSLSQIEASFDASYNWPQPKAEAILRNLGTASFEKLRKEYIDPSEKPLKRNYTPQEVDAFVTRMKERIAGKFDVPDVAQNMGWLQYGGRPATEMLDRKTVTFTTAGHPKSGGIDVSISAPASWLQKEGERPQILQQWASQNGSGDMNISLAIKSDEGLVGIQEKDVSELFADTKGRPFVRAEDEVLDSKIVHIDGAPSIRMDYITAREIAGHELTYFFRNYSIFQSGAMIQLSCTVARPKEERKIAEQRFSSVQDLCERVVLTLSISNRYP
jgi:hypothetical protein